jgi:flagellar biosynthesis protein FlhF
LSRPADRLGRRRAIRSYKHHRTESADAAEKSEPWPSGDDDDARVTDHGLYRQLIAQDVEETLAAGIISVIETRLRPEQDQSSGALVNQVEKALDTLGVQTAPAWTGPGSPTVVLFIGLSGTGKTGVVVKLASQMALNTSSRVAMISLDNQRIAGTEPLKVCSRILKVPFVTAFTPDQFKEALRRIGDIDLILVDTPALTIADSDQVQRFRKITGHSKNLKTCLVCSATTRMSSNIKLLPHLKAMPPDRLVITKLDESDTCGCLLNLPVRLQLPLAAVSNRPNGMESLSLASLKYLAGMVLGHEATSQNLSRPSRSDRDSTWTDTSKGSHLPSDSRWPEAATGISGPYFIANKNSDVFHTPDCRWTKMIKNENVIVFTSAAEAGRQHFKPCRSCCQDHLARLRSAAWSGGRQKLAYIG